MWCIDFCRQTTPLDTLEVIDANDDDDGSKLLASPYLDKQNTKTGDKCIYIGEEETAAMWTEECNSNEPLQIWYFEAVKKNSDKFYLVNGYSGKCVKPISNKSGSLVQPVDCTSEKDLVWRWFEGQ